MCRFLPYFLQNLRVLKYVGDERKAEWGKHWIEQGFNGKVAAHVLSMSKGARPPTQW